MATLDDVGETLELQVADKGEIVRISIVGTYIMTILFQKEVGSPGSGAWQTLRTFNTEDETVAEDYVTTGFNEKLRLNVTEDTSGSTTSLLTETSIKDINYREVKDRVGNSLQSFSQGGVTFPGSFQGGGPIAGSTMTLDPETHANRVIVFPAAGGVVTLPAALGTGVRYRISVKILLSTEIVINAVSGDVFVGGLMGATDVAGITFICVPGDDVITFNKTTTGGLAGTYVEIEDIAAGFWQTTGWVVSSGAESTPFSQV